MSHKSNVCTIFLEFQNYFERYFNSKIIIVQSDWGGKYRSLSKILQNLGISHCLSCPHTHQQNGVVERKHRHIVEIGLAILSHAYVPLNYWDDAFQTACYLINRMPTPLLKNPSLYKVLFHTCPGHTLLRVFGCACWPNLRPYNSHKL
jgi:transposase InsO family protein